MKSEEKYLKFLEESITQLDKYQKNTERIIDRITSDSNERNVVKEYTLEEKRKAAYALNLCTVSVSQITDYKDVVILEQEYELILNNLNLENMPKDEALLNILKQLLDTITYFRIEEGDKAIIDKEYEHRMRNAIWSAVPNFGLIVAGGNPLTLAISIASQVGIGFMNYRKNKAEYQFERERELWQLQRTAIEQLNGLRRELFDAAWRLSAEYNFPDEFRLTEKQIALYNHILTDDDPVRRYERLAAIKDKFQAYAPFWYFLGNTVLQIEEISTEEEQKEYWRERAIDYFNTYFDINRLQLLREDQIAAACALEYAEILDFKRDIHKIEKLIEIAEKNSGGSFDVLQLCAIQYLRIGNQDKAKSLLMRLVNEDYNAIFNAQVLSNIYVSDYIYSRDSHMAEYNYNILTNRVGLKYLFRMPNNEEISIDEINNEFYIRQREMLLTKYHNVLKQYIERYTIKFNKLFPMPKPVGYYTDEYFLDNELARAKRIDDLTMYISGSKGEREYCEKLKNSDISSDFLNLINEMYNELMCLDVFADPSLLERHLAHSIVEIFKECVVNSIEKISRSDNVSIDFENIINLSFRDITFEFYRALDLQLREYINECSNMEDLATASYKLYQFCRRYDLRFVDDHLNISTEIQSIQPERKVFSSKLFGEGYEEIIQSQNQNDIINDILDCYESDIVNGNKVAIKRKGTAEYVKYINKLKDDEIKADSFAVVDAKNGLDADLVLTKKGVISIKKQLRSKLIPYNQLTLGEKHSLVEINNGELKKKISNVNTIANFTAASIATDVAIGMLNPVGLIAKKGFEVVGAEKALAGIHPFKYENKNVNIQVLYSMLCKLKQVFASNESIEKHDRSVYDFLDRPLL